MRLLPLGKCLVRPREIEVVHLLKAVSEVNRRWEIGGGGCAQKTQDGEQQAGAGGGLRQAPTSPTGLSRVTQARRSQQGCYRCEQSKGSRVVLPTKMFGDKRR